MGVLKKELENSLVTGNRSVALGIDAQVKPCGKCNHPNKREVRRELLDGLPISEGDWTHCLFCWSGECVFAGECEHREVYKDGK